MRVYNYILCFIYITIFHSILCFYTTCYASENVAIGNNSLKSQLHQNATVVDLNNAIYSAPVVNQAQNIEPQDHNHCVSAISIYEKKYGLPRGLLQSIALVESGLWSKSKKKLLPHPWSLNINGKSYYFKTQAEALAFFKSSLARGIENIDVGCGQVNWRVHGKYHFKKPENALNPTYNIAYAAYFLSKNFAETRNWRGAIAMYHSRSKEKGEEYYAKVKNAWQTVNKSAPSVLYAAHSNTKTPMLNGSRTHHKLLVQNTQKMLDKKTKSSTTVSVDSSDALSDDIIVFARSGVNSSERPAVIQ